MFAQLELLEKVACVARRIIFEVAEDVVAKVFVERQGLETKGVAVGMEAAAHAGHTFSGVHEMAADAAPPEFLIDPEVSDEEPIPVGIAEQSADDPGALARHDDHAAMVFGRYLRIVVADQGMDDLLLLMDGKLRLDADGE